MTGFHMVSDITIGMYSLAVLAACAVYTTLRTAGVWRWIGATYAAAVARMQRDVAAHLFDPEPIAVGEYAGMDAHEREVFEHLDALIEQVEPKPARRPRRKRRPPK